MLGDEVFKLHLVPSGVLYPHIVPVIGPGVVVNPATLIDELDGLTSRGIDVGRLRVELRGARDPAVPPGARRRPRDPPRRGEGRDDRPRDRAGLRGPRGADRPPDGGPARRGRAARRSSSGSCPTRTPSSPRSAPRPGSRSSRSSSSASPGAAGSRPISPTRRGSSRTPSGAASTSCSRAPRARSSTSTTAPIPS